MREAKRSALVGKRKRVTANNDTLQTKAAEKHLRNMIDKICKELDIHRAEWDMDQHLYHAIINSSKRKLSACTSYFTAYDSCYSLTKTLKIKVGTEFRWFTGLDTEDK